MLGPDTFILGDGHPWCKFGCHLCSTFYQNASPIVKWSSTYCIYIGKQQYLCGRAGHSGRTSRAHIFYMQIIEKYCIGISSKSYACFDELWGSVIFVFIQSGAWELSEHQYSIHHCSSDKVSSWQVYQLTRSSFLHNVQWPQLNGSFRAWRPATSFSNSKYSLTYRQFWV